MEKMLEIPKDRKASRAGILCLLMGLTLLLVLSLVGVQKDGVAPTAQIHASN